MRAQPLWLLFVLPACQRCPELPRGGHVRPPPPAPATPADPTGLCSVDPDSTACLAERPRCAADDPKCGPAPGSFYAGCYRPDEPREAQRFNSMGGCSHDGECRVGGCGGWCVSYVHAGLTATCIGDARLERDDLLCGCVVGHCSWFTQ